MGWGHEPVEKMDDDAEEGDVDGRHEGEGVGQQSDDRLRVRGGQHCGPVVHDSARNREGKGFAESLVRYLGPAELVR